MKKIYTLFLLVAFVLLSNLSEAQITLSGTSYTQNFDGVGTALPTGWSGRYAATSTALGTAQTFVTTQTAWSSTTAQFNNVAAPESPATSADVAATQNGRTDRTFGVRQTATTDADGNLPAFCAQLTNTTGFTSFTLNFNLQQCDPGTAARTVTWIVDYGFGASPTTWTTITTTPSTLTTTTGTWTSTAVSVNFGSALDNNSSNVWIRIRASGVSSGSGNRPHTCLDDFVLSFSNTTCTPPSQASSLSTNTPTTDGFSAAWTAGTGNGTMIVVRPTAQANTLPSSSAYTPNLAWASAAQIDVNNRVIFRAAGTTAGPVTGLTAETQYTVTAYEYNTTGNCYNTTSPPSTTRYTLSLEPSAHPAAFTSAACSNTAITLAFSAASTLTNADGYIILRRQDGTNPSTTGITDGVAPGSLSLPSGTTLVTTIASTSTVSFSDAVSAGVTYNYLIIPYNASSGAIAQTYNYIISGSPKTTSATSGNASVTSDIIEDPTFTYNSDILYANFQGNPISSTSNSSAVLGLRLRDGAGSNDADALPTILKSITFTVNSVAQTSVRRYALFDGNALITEIANPGTSTVTFSGLSITTGTDFANKDFTLRVSFNNTAATIVDNTQMTFAVASATSTADCSTASSQFSAFSTVNSSTTGNRNRIEVVAKVLSFTQQPSNATNGAIMTPSVTIVGIDNNKVTDLDQATSVSVACSTPLALTGNPVSASPSSGIATFGSLIHTIDGNFYTLTASASGLRDTTSNTYNITTFTYANGDYRPKYDYDDFSFNNSTGMTDNWEYYNGSSWTTTPGDKAPQNASTTPTRIIIDHIVYGAGSTTHKYNDIIIQSGGELILTDDDNPPVASEFINASKKIEVLSGGKLTIQGDIDLPSTGNLIVRSGGQMEIDQAGMTNDHPMWDGVELFEGGSTVTIKNWSFSSASTVASLINVSTAITSNANGWKFGKLVYDVNTGTNNWSIIGGGIGIINLTENNFVITNTAAPQYYITGATNKTGTNGFIVNDSLIINNGSFAFGSSYSNDPFSHQFTVNGSFVDNSDDTLRTHYIGNSNPSSLTGYVNFKKNVTVANTVKLFASYKATDNTVVGINLNGTGTPVQELKIYPTTTAVPITIKTNASVLQKSTDIILNSLTSVTSDFTVETGATYNFGFNDAGTTPLIIKLAASNVGTNRFVSQSDATLKITHNRGLMANPTTDALGNVQGILQTNRVINTLGTFWYLGIANQNTGDCFGTSSNGRNIIVELANNGLNLQATVAFGLTNANSAYRTVGGLLDIRRGLFKEIATTGVTSGSTGTLYMASGTGYEVKANSVNNKDLIPRMDGVTVPYKLSVAGTNANGDVYGGTILLTGDGTQIIRGARTYANLALTNTTPTTTSTKYLSSNATIDSTLYIWDSPLNLIPNTYTIVDCVDTSSNSVAFTGNGGLNMISGKLRIKMLSTPSPQLNATNANTTYALTGGTIEFYGSGATQQQQIRGNYGGSSTLISYYNMEINAAAANYSTTNGGNVDLTSSFTLQGAMNVNSPAVLRMDETDFIYKYTGNITNNVNILTGSGLLYGSPFGITTVGTGGTGLNPAIGAANAAAGNIRTNVRTFSTGASYGFIGNGNMVSGDGIPSTVAGLYTYKTASTDIDTLSKSVLNNGILGLYNGKIFSTSTNKLTLETTASIVNTPTNAGGLTNMGHENSYVIGPLGRNSTSVTPMIFPIGSAAKYGPIALTPQGTTSQTYSCEYTSTGYGTYTLDPANSPQLDHVSKVEWWNVTSTASGSNDDAIVKLFWRTHSLVSATNTDWSNLRVAHFDGTDWNTEGNSPTIAGSVTSWGSVESDIYVPNFSPLTIATITANNPLPVELTRFIGNCNGDYVQLDWTTASEKNSKLFIIERSSDGIHFANIGNVNAAGFSNTIKNYSFIDSSSSTDNYYRLVELDNDNAQQTSVIIKVTCDGVNGTNIFYTPTNGIEVETYSTTSKEIMFNVYEVSGKLLHQESKQISQGYNKFSLELKRKLANGIYLIQQIDGSKSTSTKVWIH